MDMKTVQVIEKDNYVVLKLDRGRANPINLQMTQEIGNYVEAAAKDENIGGIILTGNPGVFSAGLDLLELIENDADAMVKFWTSWHHMVNQLVSFPKPLIASINGHSPAGGCVMAVCCDYRVMANGERYKIGLNELAVGIEVPDYIFKMYSFWIGKRNAYQNLMVGKLLNVKEAKAQNLVDEVVEQEEVVTVAERKMSEMLRVPSNIFMASKMTMRQELLNTSLSDVNHSYDRALKQWFNPKSRADMEAVVTMLKAKK